jgi:hypothetical protein
MTLGGSAPNFYDMREGLAQSDDAKCTVGGAYPRGNAENRAQDRSRPPVEEHGSPLRY